ncbi:helix-turn-helix transcriptional regulator [Pseudomonas syringae]|uniref:helix-turn-helix transcriptional regulator n=1 Tax=Pseudomonas syringae TaxID=317 RepID=UPI0003FE54A1|nr:LuxR family transcriptional regulator [Pseudomonas syringae]MBI6768031.1 autoinducer binding domain-containing protein [Pseudomonas syringae]MBI6786968.1 autoinducer binding domain-containing protein [Pseudomonas syringae]OBS39575.1 helix-turn-helix transcriptional regulator [Pseudomonas syringae pv. syringae]QVI77080.1 autoinducer binding domain-containing protein [Pseudomonas syringae]QVK33974.1 autoinducer binding domain-containing protein [Pseudomonas syringae]
MGSAMTESATRDLLIQQMVSTITELDGQAAIENALEWLRRECNSERAMFFQFKGPVLLTFITSNVDDAWGDAYRQHDLITQDPVIRCYRNQLGFLNWQDAFRQYPVSAFYDALVDTCELHPAISYGYTNHCRGADSVTSVCTLGEVERPISAEQKYLMSSLMPVLHSVARGIKFCSRGLTHRELEVLQWARDGKTAWEISMIRDVSESTVKYHLKTIYSKLGVANRAQAVGEALCRGLIR